MVVDKPFAASISDALSAIDAARERKKLLTVYQNRRWDGDFLTLRQLVAAGRFGRVLRFESRFSRWRPVPQADWRLLEAPEKPAACSSTSVHTASTRRSCSSGP